MMRGVLQRWVVAVSVLVAPATVAGAAANPLDSAPLPGGVEQLRRALGDRTAMSPATVVLELTRRFYNSTDAAAERDPAYARFQTWLSQAAATAGASAKAAQDLVPLPAPLEFWRQSGLDAASTDDVVLAVLKSRGGAFLYTALLSMDSETRAWFVERPTLVSSWSEADRGGLLVAAPYLRVASGRCELPGGPDLAGAWAGIVGVAADLPEACVASIVRAHSGHLPFLLEVIGTLSAGQQQAALLGAERSQGTAAARTFLAAVRQLSGAWRAGDRPFSRPSPDPALLLAQIGVAGNGRLALPGGRRFWALVVEDDDLELRDDVAQAAWRDDQPLTSAWLVERLAKTPVDGQADVYQQMLFASRLLADEPVRDAAAVGTAIRAVASCGPLMRVLERLGIDDAATLARVARYGDALARAGQDAPSRARIAQWQALLALLDRLGHRGVLTTPERAAAIDALTQPASSSTRSWRQWLTAIVPQMPARADLAERPVERALLTRVSGSPVTARPVEWEGTSYLIDFGAAEHDRIARVRGRDGRALLDAAVMLDTWLDTETGTSPDALRLLTAVSAGAGLDRPLEPGDDFGRLARDAAVRARRRLAELGDREAPPAVRADVAQMSDALAALALAEFAYAVSMGWAEDLPLTAAAASRRHVFVRAYGPERQRFWIAPSISAERRLPWHVSGSFLGLDIALAPVAMRRLSLRPPTDMPLLNTGDRANLVATAAVLSERHFGDEAQQAVTALVGDGRARIDNLSDPIEVRRMALNAGLSSQRAAAAEWLAASDRQALPDFFSMTELVRIPLAGKPLPGALDAWGNYELPLSGRATAGRFPELPVERYGGRARRLLAIALPELQVTLAVRLAELNLPAALVPAVMASATLDVVNTTPSRFADDWQAVVERVRAIDATAVERYVGLLTTGGPLRRIPANRR